MIESRQSYSKESRVPWPTLYTRGYLTHQQNTANTASRLS